MSLEGQAAAYVTHPLEAACVKDEPEWDSDDANNKQELGSVVLKEELEVGPVVLQPPDAVYAVRALLKKEETDCRTQVVPRRTCSVILERMLVDMDLCLCKIGHQMYKFQSCLENDSSHSDEEFNAMKKFGSPARLGNKELKSGQAKTNKFKVLLQKKSKKLKRKIIPNSDNSPFKCNQCSSTFNHRCNLKVHLRIHSGEKPFKCNQCNSMFTHRLSLSNHLTKHSGEKPFKCNHCNSTFTYRTSLLNHLKTHTGEKPFKCNQCISVFTQRGHLKSHLRKHSGEKPFKCNLCSSMFSHTSSLLNHLRTHTGEKPFKCNQCVSVFRQRGHLQSHLRIHSGENPGEPGRE